MRELFMSPVSVKNPAMSTHRIAISESYPERNGAIVRDIPIIKNHDKVRIESTLELIFCIISGLSWNLESSLTVIV